MPVGCIGRYVVPSFGFCTEKDSRYHRRRCLCELCVLCGKFLADLANHVVSRKSCHFTQTTSFRENAYNQVCGIVYMLGAGCLESLGSLESPGSSERTELFENLLIERTVSSLGPFREGSFLWFDVRGSLFGEASSSLLPHHSSLITCHCIRSSPLTTDPCPPSLRVGGWDSGTLTRQPG
jgi:hypothetical protein